MPLSHHTLIAWKRADDLFIKLHRLSFKAFPAFEQFELGRQLRRAAFSVAVNIVEGFGRPAGRGRLNFLNISQSSLAEATACMSPYALDTCRRSGRPSARSRSNRLGRHWLA